MSRPLYSRREADRHLGERCPKMAVFIERCAPFRMPFDPEKDLFCYLSRAICYQQLSGKAARTIHGRYVELFEGARPEPGQASVMSIEQMRSVGLSNNKALAIQDLARKSLDGTLASRASLVRRSDEAVIDNLCQVRGIGPWTVQMLLMFNFGRPDVMPVTDLGVQKGVQVVYRTRKLPAPDEVLARTRRLAPYRTMAANYFWRAADTALMA